MKVLMDNVLENESQWIAQKVNTIGSGDIACIAGADRFKTPLKLWAVKTCREAPDPENDHMWWGKLMEAPIAQLCKRKLGLEIEYGNKLYGHDTVEWATATPDYFARGFEASPDPFSDGAPSATDQMILECKNVSWRGKQFWAEETPLAPRIQVMWQMGVAGINRSVIAPLIGGDHESFEARYVQFDSRIFDQLLQLADKFMWHVKKDVPPPPTAASDAKVIDKIFPKLEDRGIDLPTEFVPEIQVLKTTAAERKELESKARKLEDEEKIIKSRLRLAMGGVKKAICGPYSIGCAMVTCKDKFTPGYTYSRVTIKGGEDVTEARHDPKEWRTAKWELYRWQHDRTASNFTVQLYDLIAKADLTNRIKLHAGFPVNVECFNAWQQDDPEEFFHDVLRPV